MAENKRANKYSTLWKPEYEEVLKGLTERAEAFNPEVLAAKWGMSFHTFRKDLYVFCKKYGTIYSGIYTKNCTIWYPAPEDLVKKENKKAPYFRPNDRLVKNRSKSKRHYECISDGMKIWLVVDKTEPEEIAKHIINNYPKVTEILRVLTPEQYKERSKRMSRYGASTNYNFI